MIKVNINGDEYMGTSEEIVKAMREKAWKASLALDEYMLWVANNIWRYSRKKISIEGQTEEERCMDFIKKLSDLGIAQMEEIAS